MVFVAEFGHMMAHISQMNITVHIIGGAPVNRELRLILRAVVLRFVVPSHP